MALWINIVDAGWRRNAGKSGSKGSVLVFSINATMELPMWPAAAYNDNKKERRPKPPISKISLESLLLSQLIVEFMN